jgi:hypothetical protein
MLRRGKEADFLIFRSGPVDYFLHFVYDEKNNGTISRSPMWKEYSDETRQDHE